MRRRARILVVDHEPLVARMITGALEDEYEVFSALDCVAALERITQGDRFDAILCEVAMPGMTGIELHRELGGVARDQRRRMVFLTEREPETRHRVLDHLDNMRLAKPISVQELHSVVRARVYAPLA